MNIKLSRSHEARGIALIIVMLVILSLSAIVGFFAYSMRVEMRLAQNNNYDSELEWIGRGGVEWARWAVGQKPQNKPDSHNDFWYKGYSDSEDVNDPFVGYNLKEIPFGENAKASVTIVDMESKWNINALASPRGSQPLIIQQALINMGVTDATLSSTISDSILDWVDPRETHHINGAKNDYYLGLNPPYYCKMGFIDDISELLLIKGIRENPEIYFGAAAPNLSTYDMGDRNVFERGVERPSFPFGFKDIFTTMGGKLNVNTADATVLQMIPGVDERGAQGIIQMRAGEDGQEGTEDDVPIRDVGMINGMNVPGMPFGAGAVPLQNFCGTMSRFFEVTVVAEIDGYKRTFHAVICRGGPGAGTGGMGRPMDPKDLQIVKFYWE